MRRTKTRRVGRSDLQRLTIAFFALLLAVVACGGNGGAADPAESVSDTGTDTTTSGGSADTGTEAESPEPEASNDGGSNRGLPPGGTGTVTIDGDTIESE